MPIEVTVVLPAPSAPTLDPLSEVGVSATPTVVVFTASTPTPETEISQAVIVPVIDGTPTLCPTSPVTESLDSLLSFNGRTGDINRNVDPAAGDYDSDQVTNASTVSGGSVSQALEWLASNTQVTNTLLTNIAGLSPTTADKLIYTTGVDTVALASITSQARQLLDDTSFAAMRTTLGLAIGTNVQAWSARLDEIAALSPTDGGFIVGDGTSWTLETGDTLLASLDAVGGRSGLTENKVLVADANGDAKNGLMTDDGAKVRVSGNFDVTGAVANFDSTTFTVGDPLIKISKDNVADAVDIGFYGAYVNSGTKYTGLFRDADNGKYRLFYGLEPEPTTTVNTSGTGYAMATLIANIEAQTVSFDTAYVPTGSEPVGTWYWDEDNETYTAVLKGGVMGQLFEEDFTQGQNDTGVTLSNGTVATYAGSIGISGNFRIEHTVASASEHPLSTMGIITQDIANGSTGKITTRGKARGFQTDGANYGEVWTDGIPVYKSSTVAGGLTKNPPQAPTPAIPVAVVISAHATNGTLFVRPTFPVKLTDLIDVNGTALTTDGQFPVWDNTNQYFDFTKNINDYIPKTQNDVTRDPTGFDYPEDVIVTGDSTTRTVTLSGTVQAYYRGELNTTIVNGWTSPAHGSDTAKQYFLIYDGTTIYWGDATAGLSESFYQNLLIAYAAYDSTNATWIYVREPHGMTGWQSHREFHQTVGTYRRSGGALQDYVLDSTTAADRRPSVEATLLYDEDLPTTSQVLNNSLYSNFYLSGADGDVNVAISQSDIVPLSGNRPYWNEFTGGVWQQTLMSNNYYAAAWVLCLPMAADTSSQQWRYLFIQPQSEDNSLSNIQALTPQDVSIGKLRGLLPELVVTNKIIIQYTAANWKIIEVSEITGTSSSQTTSPAGNYLTSVTSDDTMSGLGTPSSPLSVIQATELLRGAAEIATQAETDAGTDDTRMVTPLKLANWSGASGGDVTGPASSIQNNIAIFADTTGKAIADGLQSIADVLNRANHTGTQLAATISDFDSAVNANTNVTGSVTAHSDVSSAGRGAIITTAEATGISAAVTHISSDGTDHGYIDQDVKTTASPTFAGGTFTGFPTTPAAVPTTDYQVANKKYVDDNAGAGGDVSGPATSIDDNIVLFDGTTGKLIKDSNIPITAISGAVQGNANLTTQFALVQVSSTSGEVEEIPGMKTNLLGQLFQENTSPRYYMKDTDAATGEQAWGIIGEAGVFELQTFNDNYSAGNSVFKVTRTGTTVDDIEMLANLIMDDQADNTKQAEFDMSGITTSTKRTFTFPDKNGTLALLDDITGGGATYVEKDATSADQTYTLPALSSTNDGDVYHLYKYGDYKLTIQPNGTDKIGDLDSIETFDTGDMGVMLMADNDNKQWHVISEAGRWGDNYTATTNPTVNDDTGDGYSVGSQWVNTTTKNSYICVDASIGAAVWVNTSGLSSNITINVATTDDVSDIQAKLDALPKHTSAGADVKLTIQFANGTHTWTGDEGLLLVNFAYTIEILGNSSDTTLSTTKNVKIDGTGTTSGRVFIITGCTSDVSIKYIDIECADLSTARCVNATDCCGVAVTACYVHAPGKTNNPVLIRYTRVVGGTVRDNYLSNGREGLYALGGAFLHSKNNDDTGTRPTYGLRALQGSVISKEGTQPAGSTANENTGTGGVIR